MDGSQKRATVTRKIFGSGEMAELTRRLNWSRTPVGPMEDWPDSLHTIVNTMLSSRHPMFLWWGEELIQFYNDAYRVSIREDKHPLALGQRGRDCWPEIWPIIGPQIDAVMSRGEATWHENQLVPIIRNGHLEDVYWTYGYSPVRDAGGTICGTLVVCTETTQMVLAQRQREAEQQRLADLFHQSPAFFAVLGGPNHIFELVNGRYQQLVGDRVLLGRSVADALPEADEQNFVKLLDRVYRTGEPFAGHDTPIHLARDASKTRELRYLDFVYQPRRDANGQISGIIVLGVDVTEGKRTEQLLLRSEKLNAVGRLASSIAHEINNPLAAVTNLVYLAMEATENPDVKQYLKSADAELRRVAGIANLALQFHRQSTNPKPAEAAQLLEATLMLYRGRMANANVSLERRERATRLFMCFDGEIRQVLSNLVANAIDAMSAGGRLLIRSRDSVDWKRERVGVRLTIADTGSGMLPQTMAKIFEPFFTTKGSKGTGLGLWISREIVDRHEGVLRIRSHCGATRSGSVFTLFLPCGEAFQSAVEEAPGEMLRAPG